MTRRAADTLFLTEGEIAARVGMTAAEWVSTAAVLERSGLPVKDNLFGNRRYWPAVKAWLDRRAGIGNDFSLSTPDGEENWNAAPRGRLARAR